MGFDLGGDGGFDDIEILTVLQAIHEARGVEGKIRQPCVGEVGILCDYNRSRSGAWLGGDGGGRFLALERGAIEDRLQASDFIVARDFRRPVDLREHEIEFVRGGNEQAHHRLVRDNRAVAEEGHHALHHMRDLHNRIESKKTGGSLDAMNRAENAVQERAVFGVRLERDEIGLKSLKMFARFLNEEVEHFLIGVHLETSPVFKARC